MLTPLHHVLRKAQRGRYAIGAFNISDLEQAQAVVMAAVKLHSPVIVNVTQKAIAYAGLEELSALVLAMAKKYPVPIVLNLDHGREVSLAKDCMANGFSGIMFDGSRLPWAMNVKKTAQVVAMGHRKEIGVEGEIGAVKYPGEIKKDSSVQITTPMQAKEFVKKTGVDALAVAIGNSHGLPVPGERLHFDALKAIQKVVKTPLVLHGASGTPGASIRKAIGLGICKINIDTDLRLAFAKGLKAELRAHSDEFDPRSLLAPARQAVQDTVEKKIILFGSRNKA